MLTCATLKVDSSPEPAPLGATDFTAFVHALDAFPWTEQHRLWDQTQEGSLPALVLQNAADQRELWFSALGGDPAGSYQLQSVSMRLRKGFFGKGKAEQDVTVVDVRTRREVDAVCRLFCDSRYDELDRELARLATLADDRDD